MKHVGGNLAKAACVISALLVVAADWPQFRGAQGSAVSEEKGLPTRWSATENIRWKVDLPGRGLSSPVIAGGRVYVTACTGYQQRRLHVLCYEAATGARLWERQLAATGGTQCHPKTSMAAPTPVTDGERVYALFATGDLACFDKNGSLLWYRSLVSDYPTITNLVGLAASPIVWDDVVLLPMENEGESFAAAVDKRTGQNRWKVERAKGINWVTPQLFRNGDRTEVLFQTSSDTTAYDPKSGRVHWTLAPGGASQVVSPLVGDGLVLVSGGQFVAVHPAPDRAVPQVIWRANKLRTSYASALYYQSRIYVMNDVGIMSCADALSGKIVWQERVLKGPFWASPVAADGNVYVVNEEGTTAVVAVGEKPRVIATNKLGETILATPALADGAVYLRSDQHLYCIRTGPKNGISSR